MRYNPGQILNVIEQGGPTNSWHYLQAHVEVLESFDSDQQAKAFNEAKVFKPDGESKECQFIRWLVANRTVRIVSKPNNDWFVSETLDTCSS